MSRPGEGLSCGTDVGLPMAEVRISQTLYLSLPCLESQSSFEMGGLLEAVMALYKLALLVD